MKQESMKLGGAGLKDGVPLQKKKSDIVDQLVGFGDNMRGFTEDIEGKLKACHEMLGAAKKLGYDTTTTASSQKMQNLGSK